MAQTHRARTPIGPLRRLLPATAASAAAAFALTYAPPALAAPTPATAGRVPVASDTAAAPAGAVDEGAAPAVDAVSMRVYLSARNLTRLRTLVEQISTPGNARYQHFLTPAQYNAAFAPTPARRAAVASWLSSCSLTVTATNAHYVSASGDPASVQCALGATVHRFRFGGKVVQAATGPASVPASVAGDVLSVSAATALAPAVRPASPAPPVPATASAASDTCSSSFGASPAATLPPAYGVTQPLQPCGYLPSQLRSAYGITSTGPTGAGARVAVVGAYASATMAADAQTYAGRHAETPWAAGQYTEHVPAGLPAQPQAWTVEETMDVEAVHALAPAADVVYVASADASDAGFVDALSQVVDDHLADIVSNSWVLGADTGVPSATVQAFEQLFLQGATEGIGFVFASGDTGSQAASQDGTGPLQTATEYPASDPFVTAVGGTTLAIDAAGQAGWETGWETDYAPLSADGTGWTALPGAFADGSGGGPSALFARPWYQNGIVPQAAGGTARRVVPDVAMDADPVTGMLVGQTFALPGASVYAEYSSGGTSLAAPLFAAVQALAQQSAGHPAGFANPALYLAAGQGAFRDVTDTPAAAPAPPAAVHTVLTVSPTGTLSTSYTLATFARSGDAGLACTAGYDNVTGLGSPTPSYFNHPSASHWRQ
jgi:subtilase family serine protease